VAEAPISAAAQVQAFAESLKSLGGVNQITPPQTRHARYQRLS